MSYNGWSNYETWNVALWINNDYGLYSAAVEWATWVADEDGSIPSGSYQAFINHYGLNQSFTGDGVHWLDSGLDYDRLDELMSEFVDKD